MYPTYQDINPQQAKIKKRLNLQKTLSLIATVAYLGLGALLIFFWFTTLMSQSEDMLSSAMLLSLAIAFLLIGLLVIPSAISANSRLKNRVLPQLLVNDSKLMHRVVFYLSLAIPLIFLLSVLLKEAPGVSQISSPIFGALLICIPILWLVHFGSWKLRKGSPQRKWGLLALSVGVTPLVIMFVELLVILVALVIFAVWASTQPQIMDTLTYLGMRLSVSGGDLDSTLEALTPYLRNPIIIIVALIAIAGVMPLVEEVFKTLGVWLLGKSKLRPEEGYVAGLLCGAGFALYEGLLNLSNAAMGGEYLFLAFGRMGGSLLHVFTGGLIGWGLASTWKTGKILKYIFPLLFSLFIHGLWNALALGAGFLPLFLGLDQSLSELNQALFYLPLIILGLLILAGFIFFTLFLRKQSAEEAAQRESTTTDL